MEKSGYYECGFRLVNSIFGSRCHGTEMKANGVQCPASRSLWGFLRWKISQIAPKVSRMQSAKATVHERELYRHVRSYSFWLIVHIKLNFFLTRSTWCTCYNTGTHAGLMQALPHGVPRNLCGITDEQFDKWNCSQTSIWTNNDGMSAGAAFGPLPFCLRNSISQNRKNIDFGK